MRPPQGRQTEVVPREILVLCAIAGAEGDFIFGPSEEMTGGTVMVITELLERNARLYGGETALVELTPSE